MVKFYYNVFNIDYDRKIEIIERSKYIKDLADRFMKYKYGTVNMTIDYKLDIAYNQYKERFSEDLNNEEKTLFYLYCLFPEDQYFLNLLKKHNKDFKKVASFYGVPEKFVNVRYLSLLKLQSEKYQRELKKKK